LNKKNEKFVVIRDIRIIEEPEFPIEHIWVARDHLHELHKVAPKASIKIGNSNKIKKT